MGTFIHDYGTLEIPQEKQEEFKKEALKIASQAGLFDCHYVNARNKEFLLLAPPSITNNELALDYSYFEQDRWEGVGINFEKMYVWSGKIGWQQFNAASQALYLLAETYSDKLCVSYPDAANRPVSTIKWLRYVLKKDLHLQWRKSIWNVIETINDQSTENMSEEECASFIDDIIGDVWNINDVAFTYAIFNGIKKIVEDYRNSEEYKKNQENDIWNAIDKEMGVYDAIEEYKRNSAIEETQQVQTLLDILACFGNNKKSLNRKLTYDERNYLLATICCPPQVSVKIICEIYKQDFWTLWEQIKDDVNRERGITKTADRVAEGELTTEEFFKVTSDDRLYWWDESGDVSISEETQRWLDQISSQHHQLCSTVEMENGIKEWQMRLLLSCR